MQKHQQWAGVFDTDPVCENKYYLIFCMCVYCLTKLLTRMHFVSLEKLVYFISTWLFNNTLYISSIDFLIYLKKD